MYLDEILEQSNTNSTRHKSKNGECHGELVFKKHNEIMKELNDVASDLKLDARTLYMKNFHGLILEGVREQEIIEDLERKEVVKSISEGVKTNKGKPQMSLLFKQFPKALQAVVNVQSLGMKNIKKQTLII